MPIRSIAQLKFGLHFLDLILDHGMKECIKICRVKWKNVFIKNFLFPFCSLSAC